MAAAVVSFLSVPVGALQEMTVAWPTTKRQPTRLQVATMRPEDSGRGIARLPRAMMTALGLAEGDVIELVGKRSTPARAVPLSRGRGARHHPPRRPAARQCRDRLGRFRRDPQGRIEAGAARRLRAGAEESAPAGLGPGAEAQLRDEAAHRRRRRRHHRPAAGAARRHPARACARC